MNEEKEINRENYMEKLSEKELIDHVGNFSAFEFEKLNKRLDKIEANQKRLNNAIYGALKEIDLRMKNEFKRTRNIIRDDFQNHSKDAKKEKIVKGKKEEEKEGFSAKLNE